MKLLPTTEAPGQEAGGPGGAPESPKTVKKAGGKSPREVMLEKQVSTLEDELASLRRTILPGAPVDAPTATAQKKGFLEGVMDDVFGD